MGTKVPRGTTLDTFGRSVGQQDAQPARDREAIVPNPRRTVCRSTDAAANHTARRYAPSAAFPLIGRVLFQYGNTHVMIRGEQNLLRVIQWAHKIGKCADGLG